MHNGKKYSNHNLSNIAVSPPSPVTTRVRARLSIWQPTLSFLGQTETHVFALSISASVLLSFFPFLIVIESLCRYTFHLPGAVAAINLALMDYFPAEIGAFVARNLSSAVEHNGPTQIVSVLLLLFTANGVFEPLEVSLNRVWGVTENRSYLKNQVLSLGLILFCGFLVLGSVILTAKDPQLARELFRVQQLPSWVTWLLFKLAAIPITIFVLFFVYWALPNRRVPARPLIAISLWVGLVLELLRYIFLLLGPFLIAKLAKEYGPFQYSVAILLLSFLSSMVVLAGAEWSARRVE